MSEPEAKQRNKSAQEQRIADCQWVMSTPSGRRWIAGLIQSCGLEAGGHIGSAEIHFRAGVREVGLRVKQEIEKACFEEFIKMLQEARAK